MDVISHGLWGSIAFGRSRKKSFWLAFLFGVLPDALSFGPFWVAQFLSIGNKVRFGPEPPDPRLIPQYVHLLYTITHSAIIFLIVFGIVWSLLKKPPLELGAWGLHILFDIPTHSYRFFPTPFLWPISSFTVSGVGWAHPFILGPNIAMLAILYLWFFVAKQRSRKAGSIPRLPS